MTFGLTQKDWNYLNENFFDPLRDQGCRIYIFGSRSREDFKEFSDLVVGYETIKPLPKGFQEKILEFLEESRLPIKVDLMNFEHVAIAYKANIFKERIQI